MFFPYRSCNIRTKKSLNEVITIIKSNTSKKDMFNFLQSNRSYFEGDIIDNKFKISRVIKYRNSFLPVVIGKIKNANCTTHINIEMRLNLFVIIFGIIWFAGAIFGLIASIPNKQNIVSLNKNTISSFMPLFMIIFGYLIFTIPFIIESKIAENKIIELVNGERE